MLVCYIIRYSQEVCHDIHGSLKPYLIVFFVPFCLHIYSIILLDKWPDFRTQLSTLKTEHVLRYCIGNIFLIFDLAKPMLNNLISSLVYKYRCFVY